jgi:hypothetical protein
VAKVKFHFGELFARAGFIVTNLSAPNRAGQADLIVVDQSPSDRAGMRGELSSGARVEDPAAAGIALTRWDARLKQIAS